VLYVSGDSEGRVLFTRIAKRWDGVKLVFADTGVEGLDMAVARRPP